MSGGNEQSVLEALEEGAREVLASESTSQRTEEDGATASSNDVTRIQQTFSRVMQKVKSAYHKELQRKKQVDLTASVDIMRTKANEEINDSESNDDDEAMQAMAKEIEVTRRLLEVSQLREEQSKQTISQLETDVAKLQKLVEEEEALRRDEGLSLQQLITLKRSLTTENEKLASENQVYSQQFILLQTELQEATGDKRRLDVRLGHLQQELMSLRETLEAETRAYQTAQEEREAIQREFELKEEDIIRLTKELEDIRKENADLAASQAELEMNNKKMEQTLESLSARHDHLVQDLEAAKKILADEEDENERLTEQLRLANFNVQERLKEIEELEGFQRNAQAQLEHFDRECRRADSEREVLEAQLEKLEEEVERVRAVASNDRQSSEKIIRENRQLHVELHEHLIAREKQSEIWKVQQDTIKRLEEIVREEDARVARLRVQLSETEQENSRWKTENGMLRKEVDDIFEVANMREKECNRLKEERVGLEKRIHQFQAIQDAATQSKAVIDHEMAKIKENNYEQERRLKTLTYMVEKLKEELSTKEALLMQAKRLKQQLEGDLETVKKNLEDQKKIEADVKATLLQHEKQLQKLQLTLQQTGSELREARLLIQSEKISRNNVEHKYLAQRTQIENLKIDLSEQERMTQDQQNVAARLEADQTLLRSELERADQERKGMAQKLHYKTSNLQRGYENLRETLLHEQARRAALEVEKRTPVLVHPWRILQSTDPTAYVTMMREQAAKRNRIKFEQGIKGRTKLPDVSPKRPISSFSRHGHANELQMALIKAVL